MKQTTYLGRSKKAAMSAGSILKLGMFHAYLKMMSCPKIFSMHCTTLISICSSTFCLHLWDSCLPLPWVSPAFYLQFLY